MGSERRSSSAEEGKPRGRLRKSDAMRVTPSTRRSTQADRAVSWRDSQPRYAMAGLVLAAAAWAYAPSLGGAFVFDDFAAIVQNPNVRTLRPIARALSAPPDTTLSGRPAASLTFALNYALAPQDAREVFEPDSSGVPDRADSRFRRNAWGYHAANVAIHLLAALSLFGVVRRTLLSDRLRAQFGPASSSLAFAIALVWVVHPLNTEAVTYIVQRVESLMGLFALLSVYCSIRAIDSSHARPWTIGALASYALALGSKEVAIGAPVAILAWDFLFHRQRWALYGGFAAISLLLVFTVPGARERSVGFWLEGWTPWSYLLTQSAVIVHYVRLVFWPAPLVLDPYWPAVRSIGPVIWPVSGLGLAFGLTVVGLVKRHPASFPGVCFFGFLAPTSSILPIATEVAAEHRMYLPLAAILSLVVVACYLGVRSVLTRLDARPRAPRVLAVLTVSTLSIVVFLLGLETRARNRDYVTDENIWRDTIAKQPNNPRARTALGADLVIAGRYQEAAIELEASLALDPARPETLSNLGLAELKLGRIDASMAHLERAVALRPEYAAAHRNLGQAYIASHQDGLAVQHLRLALDAQPNNVGALKDLGLLLAVTSDDGLRNGREALRLAERAVALTSRRDPAPLAAMAAALAELDRFDDALAALREAGTLSPDRALATQLSQLDLAYAEHRKVRRPSR